MKLATNLELGRYFTFEPSKHRPIYNWFYYKEGFSPEIVEWAVQQEVVSHGSWVVGGAFDTHDPKPTTHNPLLLDPFCGTGTSLLTAKSHQLPAIGFDISPVATMVAKTKCENYDATEMQAIEQWARKVFTNLSPPTARWEFELFSPRAAFPAAHFNHLVSLREAIQQVEERKIQHFLLTALLSIIPQVGIFIKDGGVLKIDRRKSAMPVKEAFRRKIKTMLRDLREHAITGPVPRVEQADARQLPVEDGVVDLVVTSPPYLNNVDYSKVYGLELSLMFLDKSITKTMRSQSVRSFITSNLPPENVPPEIGEAGYKVPVIGNYFMDMERVLGEVQRVLKPGGACYLIVGNSVIYGLQIFVDELLASIGERLGMQVDIIIGSERWADVKPRKVKIRESILIFRK